MTGIFLSTVILSASALIGLDSPGDPVNDRCPIMADEEVNGDSPSATYRGFVIGFCCPKCEKKWAAKPEADKMAFLIKYVPNAAKSDVPRSGTIAANDANALPRNPAVKVAHAYLAACAKADADTLNGLFLDKGRASVSENASDEGTWETYRDHHLMPELREMPGFLMMVTKEDVQTFGATSVVRQIGTFSVPDPQHQGLTKKYLAAVTYVVVDEGGAHKIAHLHWSSRVENTPAAIDASPDSAKTDSDHRHGGEEQTPADKPRG